MVIINQTIMFKSIKTGVIALLLVGTAVIANAQKKMDQGTVIYGISYELSPEQKTMIDPSMLPTESSVDFNGNFASIKIESGPALVHVITDKSTKTGLILVDVPVAQKQFATKMSAEEMEAQKGDMKYSNFKATGEKQNIAGFNAEKYTYTDNKGASYELWATKDIQLASGASYTEFADVKGTPVKFMMINNGLKSSYIVKSIKEAKVGPFSLAVPAGYEVKTMAEMQAMQSGGQ
jgi:hypothetical protein